MTEAPPEPLVQRIPFAQSDTEVRVRGQNLHPVLWRGEQWAVTKYGMECRDGTYAIKAGELLRKRIGTALYDWPLHMREKVWVDVADFRIAFAVACFLHHRVPIEQLIADLRSSAR